MLRIRFGALLTEARGHTGAARPRIGDDQRMGGVGSGCPYRITSLRPPSDVRSSHSSEHGVRRQYPVRKRLQAVVANPRLDSRILSPPVVSSTEYHCGVWFKIWAVSVFGSASGTQCRTAVWAYTAVVLGCYVAVRYRQVHLSRDLALRVPSVCASDERPSNWSQLNSGISYRWGSLLYHIQS